MEDWEQAAEERGPGRPQASAEQASTSGLRPNAPSFSFNPGAASFSFKPSTPAAQPGPAQQPAGAQPAPSSRPAEPTAPPEPDDDEPMAEADPPLASGQAGSHAGGPRSTQALAQRMPSCTPATEIWRPAEAHGLANGLQEKLRVSEPPKPPPRKAEARKTTDDEEMDEAEAKLERLNAELAEADDRCCTGQGRCMAHWHVLTLETRRREHMNVVFIGHVDAGKSTTCGQILLLTVRRALCLHSAAALWLWLSLSCLQGGVDERTIQKYERCVGQAGLGYLTCSLLRSRQLEAAERLSWPACRDGKRDHAARGTEQAAASLTRQMLRPGPRSLNIHAQTRVTESFTCRLPVRS